MKQKFSVVEKNNRYFLYEGDHEYTTPCLFNISSRDKGLVEAIARKISENKPNLVKLYLRKYSNAELVELITDLSSSDIYIYAMSSSPKNPDLWTRTFKNIQLRKLIDAYSDCGSINMAISICVHDVEEDFDYFMAGMAACSGISICPEDEDAELYFDDLCEFFEDKFGRDVSEELSTDFLESLIRKHNAHLLPKGPRARSNFYNTLRDLT